MLEALEAAPDGLTMADIHVALYGAEPPPKLVERKYTYYMANTDPIRGLIAAYNAGRVAYARPGKIVSRLLKGLGHKLYMWQPEGVTTYQVSAPSGATRIIVETPDDALVYTVDNEGRCTAA
jgi:hypothetical protein